MKENINALDEINKGSCMGMDAIKDVLEKVEDEKFKNVIEVQYDKYKKMSDRINKLYKKYNSENEPHETNIMNKMMTKYGIDMKTFADKSNSKIAELLLQGTNMGIIEGRKILNQKEISDEVRDLVSEYVTMQEESVEILKEFL